MNGILNLHRPTMGFDVWSAVAQGVKKGVNEYQADPNKAKLPSLGISLPKVALPSWVTQSAKAIGKPAEKIGKNVYSSVQAAREADKRKAEARANSVGASNEPPLQEAEDDSIFTPTNIGIGLSIAGILYAGSRR